LATASLWWSTGKNSAWALHVLTQDPNIEVERLITTTTPMFDRVAIHGTRVEILEAQAEAGGLPDPLKARHRSDSVDILICLRIRTYLHTRLGSVVGFVMGTATSS